MKRRIIKKRVCIIKGICILIAFFVIYECVYNIFISKKLDRRTNYSIKTQELMKAAEDIIESSEGITYYIASDGTSTDGTDINNPMSLEIANMKEYTDNDKILFKAGDTFYGKIKFKVATSKNKYILISSYGDGEKPIISGANILINPQAWELEDGLYKLDLTKKENFEGIGNVNYNIGFFADEQGNIYGNRKQQKSLINNEFDYYCDEKFFYVKCSENPSNKLGKIKFANKNYLVNLSSNTILENLDIQYTGSHGIIKKNDKIENVLIRDCILQNIGGTVQDINVSFNRYGNGIEFWDSSKNTIVENCIFRNIYDAAYTTQGTSVTTGYENNICQNNIFINCTYPIEISCRNSSNPLLNIYLTGQKIMNNISINQGRGWGYEVRPDKSSAAEFVLWRMPNDNTDIEISNNSFFNSRRLKYSSENIIVNNYKKNINSDNNKIYLSNDAYLINNSGYYKDKSILNTYGTEQNSLFHNLVEQEKSLINNQEIIYSNDYNKIKTYYEGLGKDFEYTDIINEIIDKYENLENTYNTQIKSIEGMKIRVDTIKQNILNTTRETNPEDIINLLTQTYDIGNTVIENKDIDNIEGVIKDIELIGKSYKSVLEITEKVDGAELEYVEDEMELQNIENQINSIKKSIEINADLDIQDLDNLKDSAINYFNNINNTENYLKKYNYLSAKYLIGYINSILNNKVTRYIEDNPITLSYSIPENELTNKNVTVTANIGQDTQIKNNNGNNEITFERNGTYDFEYSRREKEGKITTTVNNIDKDSPVISEVEQGKVYINEIVTPVVEDEHLEKVELFLNEENIPSYQVGDKISTEGKYKIIATDLASNSTEIDFEVINKVEKYKNALDKLIELYDNFDNTYNDEIGVSETELVQIKKAISNTTFYTKAENIINLLEQTLNFGYKILENNLNNKELLFKDIITICEGYEEILSLNEEVIETDITDLKNKSNELDNLIETNSDLNIEDLVDLIRLFKKYRNNIIYTENYVKKYYYIVAENLSNYINILINNKITQYIEANPITLSYSEDINKLTRNDITVTLNKGEDTKITCNNGSNTYTFNKNGSYVFSYERRGRKGKLEAKVENIDKDSPTIKGVVDGISYTSKRTPRVSDEHLDIVELYFNDEVVENYTVGSTLTEIGKYRIVATDLVGNVTAVDFEIREITDNELIETDYNVDNNFIKGVLPNTSYEQFIKNIETTSSYIIKRDGKELSIEETKTLATGDILEFPNVNKSYKLIVAGDINKDGNVNAKDLVRMRRYLLGQVKFDEIETYAADVNVDGKEISARDFVRLRVIILNK